MKSWLGTLLFAASISQSISPSVLAASANLVVMQANPNGVPGMGAQYLLGIQIAGIASPTFLGTNLISFAGDLKNTSTTAPGSFYSSGKVLFETESNSATAGDGGYSKSNDSYFASPWQTLLASPNGAGETVNSLFIDGGTYGAMPARVPADGTYPFAYINVTAEAGVSITGTFAIGSDPATIGNGDGLRLTLDGQLVSVIHVNGDFNGNGVVDAADYVLWRSGGPLLNDSTAGVGPDDYELWRSRFGVTTGAGALVGTVPTAVPEPSSIGLFAIAIWWNQRYQCGG